MAGFVPTIAYYVLAKCNKPTKSDLFFFTKTLQSNSVVASDGADDQLKSANDITECGGGHEISKATNNFQLAN